MYLFVCERERERERDEKGKKEKTSPSEGTDRVQFPRELNNFYYMLDGYARRMPSITFLTLNRRLTLSLMFGS